MDDKQLDKINIGRKAGLAYEVFGDMLDSMREDLINQMINNYAQGQVDQLAIAQIASLRHIKNKLKRNIDIGHSVDAKVIAINKKGKKK